MFLGVQDILVDEGKVTLASLQIFQIVPLS